MELGGGYTVDVCLGIPRMHPNESNGWLMVNIICTWWICKIDGSFLQVFFLYSKIRVSTLFSTFKLWRFFSYSSCQWKFQMKREQVFSIPKASWPLLAFYSLSTTERSSLNGGRKKGPKKALPNKEKTRDGGLPTTPNSRGTLFKWIVLFLRDFEIYPTDHWQIPGMSTK